MKNIIKTIIRDFHEKDEFELKPRDIDIPLKSGKIVAIIGSRRSGKTFTLYKIINQLRKTIKKENILYFNFEDERIEFSKNNLNTIVEAYFELYPNISKENVVFLFDEIQNIDGWELFIRRIYDNISKNIFITGSSSKHLSKEIATSLRGRSISYEIYPLSFKEYLK